VDNGQVVNRPPVMPGYQHPCLSSREQPASEYSRYGRLGSHIRVQAAWAYQQSVLTAVVKDMDACSNDGIALHAIVITALETVKSFFSRSWRSAPPDRPHLRRKFQFSV